MSKALVRARGVATPDQFKTDWSQFMKQNIAMNMMVYPFVATMDKSDNAVKISGAIPRAMIDKGQSTDKVYMLMCVKNDDNKWESFAWNHEFSDFDTLQDIGGNDFMTVAASTTCTIVGSKFTAGLKYDVHILFSDQEINTEVAESVNDLPYVLYGPASEYIIEITCAA